MFDRIMPLNSRYHEIIRLHDMLAAVNVPHLFERIFDGWQISYPCSCWDGERVCSAIEHRGSYGHEDDRLEIMGLLTDEEEQEGYSVLGWLTADDVYLRICKHYACTPEVHSVEKEKQ